MCQTCYNADTFEEKVKKYGKNKCDGSDMLFMTVNELKERLEQDSVDEKKNAFRIFDKAITDLPKGTKTLTFTPTKSKNPIHVQFV